MSETATSTQQTTTATQPETTPQAPVQQPQAPQQAVQTPTQPQPQQTVDMTQIEKAAQERAERAAQAAVKDMLKQQGLDDGTVKQMLAEFKAKQVTPEQTIKDLTKDVADRDSEIAMYKQREILRGHGMTDVEEIEIMMIRIERLITDQKDFEAAAKEYFDAKQEQQAAQPQQQKPPATVVPGVTGNAPMTATEQDEYTAKYKQAVKDRNTAEMSRLTRLAAEKGIILRA